MKGGGPVSFFPMKTVDGNPLPTARFVGESGGHLPLRGRLTTCGEALTVRCARLASTESNGLTRKNCIFGVERATSLSVPLNMVMALLIQRAKGEMELVPSAVGPDEMEQRGSCAEVRTLRGDSQGGKGLGRRLLTRGRPWRPLVRQPRRRKKRWIQRVHPRKRQCARKMSDPLFAGLRSEPAMCLRAPPGLRGLANGEPADCHRGPRGTARSSRACEAKKRADQNPRAPFFISCPHTARSAA